MTKKSYSELVQMKTFEDRYKYLKLSGSIGSQTFGFDRYLNQKFYKSLEWKKVRDFVIVRDNGCDLGCPDKPIFGKILIHHMNPITIEDISNNPEEILNPEYLISVSLDTHNAIHYGDKNLLMTAPIERSPNDTCPWKR